MKAAALKLAVVEVLRSPPDSTALFRLRQCSERERTRLLRWLDESGLALYFLKELESSGLVAQLPVRMVRLLQRRREANRVRMTEMFSEFVRVNNGLHRSGARYAIIKGFALGPEFCPDICVRHQSDIDVLVSGQIGPARDAVASCGYTVEEENPGGEIRMSSPLTHCPSKHDDIYAIPRQRRVELHTSIFDQLQGVSIDALSDCLSETAFTAIGGEQFPVLSLHDRFVLQCLHVFRHVLACWGRLSWLYEIHGCLNRYEKHSLVWERVVERLTSDRSMMACGLVLLLSRKLFLSPIPLALQHCTDSSRIRAWVEEFGYEFALSGMEGSKASLLVHREFISDEQEWNYWLRRRILPLEQRPALGGRLPLRLSGVDRLRQALRYVERSFYHAKALFRYVSDLVRWRRVLQQM